MYILGNAIISRIFSTHGFLFNDKGLFYIVDSKHKYYEILISNDVKKIVELLGMNFEDVDNKDEAEFFKVIVRSPYFKAKRFKEDVSEGGSKLLSNMVEFLKTNGYNTMYQKLQLDTVFQFFKDSEFEETYKKAVSAIKNFHEIKSKFNGSVILKHIPEFDKYQLGETIHNFNHAHFSSDVERDYFILTSSEEDIIKEFVESTKQEAF